MSEPAQAEPISKKRLVSHPSGPHAFDVFDDTDASREIIREMLVFMRFHLAA